VLASYAVKLDDDGCLGGYARLTEGQDAPTNATVWHSALMMGETSSWFNNEAYVDTLSVKAIEKFIEVTHQRYADVIGDDFGGAVPAIFTDEPAFREGISWFNDPFDADDRKLPWTDDLVASFQKDKGHDILDRLPEVFWELPGGEASVTRYDFHDHLSERFAVAFADTIGDWCIKHGIALTGHLLEEATLTSQSEMIGEAMRSYRSFQIPGIDMLCDLMELSTAKQAQSAARQYGAPGVLSELYGVTGWDFPFSGHKRQGDWQAALGVTVRVQHLSWVSMAGEAKRDYPASISYQSPWFREYPVVEDHFARVNSLLTRGKSVVRVGVLHPVESFWLAYGPLSQTALEREERETCFKSVIEWLTFGLHDFDFICESLLPSQGEVRASETLTVGEMAYDVVVVPGMRTIRASTLDRLEAFSKAGGRVLFLGQIPTLVNAMPSERPMKLAADSECLPMSRAKLLQALDPVREVKVTLPNGTQPGTVLHQIRQDGDDRHVFLCNSSKHEALRDLRVRFKGRWSVRFMDTFTGTSCDVPVSHEGEWTTVQADLEPHGSLLYTLTPSAVCVSIIRPCVAQTSRMVARRSAWLLLPETKR